MFIFFKKIFYLSILVAMFVAHKHDIINGVILEIGILGYNFLGRKFKYSIKVYLNQITK
jgi:hypothetical protein